MTHVEVTQTLADLLAAKVAYKRQFNATFPLEQAIMEGLQELIEENKSLAVEISATKQSSPELSSLAAGYMSVDLARLAKIAQADPDQLLKDIRRMAASVVSQDERPKT